MKEIKLKNRFGYALACPACDCGDTLLDQQKKLVIFDKYDDALEAVNATQPRNGQAWITKHHIIKVAITQHG